jgi:hypothetical protein
MQRLYYLTYSVVDWLPVFVSQAGCQIVTDSLTFCHRQKHLRINAFVVMPTHLHLIVFDADGDAERLVRSLADCRKYTGRQLSDYCAGMARSVFWKPCATRPPRTGSDALATEPPPGSDSGRAVLAAKACLPS